MTPNATRRVPLLDLVAQHEPMREEIHGVLRRLVDSQRFVLGEEVERLEEEIAAYCGTKYAVGCASGTDALLLAMMVLGIGQGDEVVTTPYSFFATVSTIVRAGATPVFVDIDPKTFNLNVAQIEEVLKKHSKVKAILPVHLYGQVAQMDDLLEIAARHGLPVIEDAAQAIGAEYKGRRVGSMGKIGCFSFFPSKNLGGYGDGGIMTMDDPAMAERLKSLREHGAKQKYVHDEVGLNSRLDALQAAVLRVKLRHLDGWHEGRRRNAALYRELFKSKNLPVVVPVEAEYSTRHVYNQFVIRCEKRDELKAFLGERGVGTAIYYPIPLHLQPCFRYVGYKEGDLPVSEACAKDTLSIPVYGELTRDDIEYVVEQIAEFHGR